MITRVARNDVVRLTRTGQVGLVKGWADHEQLAQNGTVLDVEIGGDGRTVQANGLGLEFVARAKIEWTRGKRVWHAVLLVVTSLWGAYIGAGLIRNFGVPHLTGAFTGFSSFFFLYLALKGWTLYPRRTRVTLPKSQPVRQSVSK